MYHTHRFVPMIAQNTCALERYKTKWLMGLAMICLAWAGSVKESRAAERYEIVDTTETTDSKNGLVRYRWIIQVGSNPLNRFMAHRIVQRDILSNSGRGNGPVLLLPGGLSGFDMYGIGGDGVSIRDSLALAGYDVYGYTPRPFFLDAGYCDRNNCSVVSGWGMQTYVDDIIYITRKAISLSDSRRLVAGGFSLGALLSIAAVNEAPQLFAGAILLEGTLYQDDPAYQHIFEAVCRDLNDTLLAGETVDDESGPFFQASIVLGVTDPSGRSPFASGMTNQTFLYYLITTPVDPPEGEAPGYTYGAGDITGWTYVDAGRLLSLALQIFPYDPIALIRDYKCAFAGERTFTDNLAAFDGPVLSIQSGLGFGDTAEATLELMERADITRLVNPKFGHGDWYAHPNYNRILVTPIIDWLDKNVRMLSVQPLGENEDDDSDS